MNHERMFIIVEFPYGESTPQPHDEIYTEDRLGEAQQRIDFAEECDFDAEKPSNFWLMELTHVPPAKLAAMTELAQAAPTDDER
jgi:hypothetical protein